VYLLDDDSSVLKSTGRLLDSAGWKVEAFTDPIAFLEQAAKHRPDVAVIDILMPEMNGLEVQTRLRRISPSTRVIVLTARDDPSVRRIAMNSGASAVFSRGCGRFQRLVSFVRGTADEFPTAKALRLKSYRPNLASAAQSSPPASKLNKK
jgi:FixJ family two-component response regulator